MAGTQANIANFFTPFKGPGRSAATLVEDLILFDPRQEIQPGYHLLEDGARAFGQVRQVGELLPDDSCIHDYRLKKRQSALPAVDARPDSSSIWKVAAICQKCHIHLDLTVDYTIAWKDEPCPTWYNPLHHLVRSSWRQNAAYRELQRDGIPTTDEVHVYECTAQKCSAVVTVHMSPPVLPLEAIHVLVDKDLLAQRTKDAFEAKAGQIEGMKQPSPLDVLADLRSYFRNSWTRTNASEIALDNKRFMVRFGPDGLACRQVLEMLGFELKPGSSWTVPQPVADDSIPLQDDHNIFMDNVEAELDVLIEGRPQEERIASQDTTKLEPASLQISRVLSSRNYDTDSVSRTKLNSLRDRAQPFTILGIPQDASDDLIIWAYKRQIMLESDFPVQTAKLMTALENIQRHRQSEKLTQQVAIERSMGRYGEQTVADAYRFLGLSANINIDDESIIGSFEARLVDAPNQEQDMRQSLMTIGEYRSSRRLTDYARNAVSSYEDAAKFLDINENMDDSYVVSTYHIKIEDNPASAEMALKAMQIIADHRNSDALRGFVASGCKGDLQPPRMDLSQAYSCFSIDDRTIGDEDLWAVFNTYMDFGDQSRDKLRQALVVIAEDRNSAFLRQQLGLPAGPQQSQNSSVSNEPVGLTNIGNTCYLNSLLQSLFTITTVRKIVLNFDQYKQDLDAVSALNKHVGQRAVTRGEIISAQNFVHQLAGLFTQMIESPYRAITPSIDLARLTLETQQAKARRSSTLSKERRLTLGTLEVSLPKTAVDDASLPAVQSPDALEISDPVAEESSHSSADKIQHIDVPPEAHETGEEDNASERTLVSQTESLSGSVSPQIGNSSTSELIGTSESVPLPSKEVVASEPSTQDNPDSSTDSKPAGEGSLLSESSGQQTVSPEPKEATKNIIHGYAPPSGPAPSASADSSNNNTAENAKAALRPPIPPRPTPKPSPTVTLEEYARQQDVTEVLAHAIIQLSSAIRPVGVDERQEQQDEIRDTFYGEERKLVLRGPASSQAPVPFLFISFPIHNEPKDLYGAFDNYFDPEEIGSSELYASITRLPSVLCFALTRVIQKVEERENEKTKKIEKTFTNIKLSNHVEIPTTLFMDRYMDAPSGSTLAVRKEQTWQYKKELRKLKSRISQLEPQGAAPVDEQLNLAVATIQHLAEVGATEKIDGLTMDTDSVHKLSELAHSVRAEREALSNRISVLEQQINDSFTDAAFRNQEYKLHALFFHRGTAAAGHYWIYIFDHVSEIWRKYNDDTVTQITNLKEIFSDPRNDTSNPAWTSNSTASPYFMMYVRADQLDSVADTTAVVETVKRSPVFNPPTPPIDNEYNNNGNSNFNDEGIDIRPLGSDTPKTYEIHSSHHEFAGQPSQMSHLPPNAPRLQGTESHTQQESEFASIGSVMQQNRPSTQHDRQSSWDQEQMQQAIQRSLQPTLPKKGEWDDAENMSVPSGIW